MTPAGSTRLENLATSLSGLEGRSDSARHIGRMIRGIKSLVPGSREVNDSTRQMD